MGVQKGIPSVAFSRGNNRKPFSNQQQHKPNQDPRDAGECTWHISKSLITAGGGAAVAGRWRKEREGRRWRGAERRQQGWEELTASVNTCSESTLNQGLQTTAGELKAACYLVLYEWFLHI